MNTYFEDEEMCNEAQLSQKIVIWTWDFEEVRPITLISLLRFPSKKYINIKKNSGYEIWDNSFKILTEIPFKK